jgi:hypothetical protein
MKTLKTTIIIILTLSISNAAYCQQKEHPVTTIDAATLRHHPEAAKGDNVKIIDTNLNKYVGTWVWKQGNKSLTLKLFKQMTHIGKNNYIELLSGSYLYIDGRNETVSSPNDGLYASIGDSSDILDIVVSMKSHKHNVALLASYLTVNSIKLQVNKNKFEFKNDQKFELSPVILTKQ